MAITRCMECMEEYEEKRNKCPYCGCAPVTEPKEVYHLSLGSLLQERYLIGKALGSGSLGITYIAWDKVLVSKVAVKEYLPVEFTTRMPGNRDITIYNDNSRAPFQEGLRRFMEEAERLACFRENTGIVRILDTFEENGTAYIVMEYLEGETLEKKLFREKKMSVEQAMSMVIPIAETMKKVHAKGMIHRNISPSNIFLTNQHEVKLMDFGAARNTAYGVTQSLSVIVKTGYAPEEQYRSKGNQGPWTDVYALAATFYRMITGILPENAIERADCDTLKLPSSYGIDISDSVECAIMNALKLDITDRTVTMDTFLKELKDEKAGRKLVLGYRQKADYKKILQYAGFSAGCILVFGMLVLFVLELMQNGHVKSGNGELSYEQIPDLTGLTYDEAKEYLRTFGVSIENVGYSYSNAFREGTIISQNIGSGNKVEKDMTVQVLVMKKEPVTTQTTTEQDVKGEEKTTEVNTTEDPVANTTERSTHQQNKATTQKASTKKKTTEKKTTEKKKEKKTTEKKTTEQKTETKTTEQKTEASTEDVIVIED